MSRRLLWIDTTGEPVITTTPNGERNARRWGWTTATAMTESALAKVEADALRDAASRLAGIDAHSDAVFWDGGGYERVTYWLKVLANQIEGAAK